MKQRSQRADALVQGSAAVVFDEDMLDPYVGHNSDKTQDNGNSDGEDSDADAEDDPYAAYPLYMLDCFEEGCDYVPYTFVIFSERFATDPPPGDAKTEPLGVNGASLLVRYSCDVDCTLERFSSVMARVTNVVNEVKTKAAWAEEEEDEEDAEEEKEEDEDEDDEDGEEDAVEEDAEEDANQEDEDEDAADEDAEEDSDKAEGIDPTNATAARTHRHEIATRIAEAYRQHRATRGDADANSSINVSSSEPQPSQPSVTPLVTTDVNATRTHRGDRTSAMVHAAREARSSLDHSVPQDFKTTPAPAAEADQQPESCVSMRARRWQRVQTVVRRARDAREAMTAGIDHGRESDKDEDTSLSINAAREPEEELGASRKQRADRVHYLVHAMRDQRWTRSIPLDNAMMEARI